MVIGVDFDNTIVSYDRLIFEEARRRGLIQAENTGQSKKEIRDTIRKLPDGEDEWQRIQACIYGPLMSTADLISGVRDFFVFCKSKHIQTYIISHKTEYANFDETGVNLREAALAWMRQQDFFADHAFGLAEADVFFGATRQEKIEHIKRLGCLHFVDDLEEMFLESTFPQDVNKILYAPHGQFSKMPDVKVLQSWEAIYQYFSHVID